MIYGTAVAFASKVGGIYFGLGIVAVGAIIDSVIVGASQREQLRKYRG